jgi:hypothetical protein
MRILENIGGLLLNGEKHRIAVSVVIFGLDPRIHA